MNRTTARKLTTLLTATSIAILALTSPTLAKDVTMQDVVRAADAGDYEVAFQKLENLANRGDAQAEGFLAYVLSIGEWHVPIDKARAETLLRSAADKGDAYANLELYLMNEPEADIQPGEVFVPSDDYLANLKAAADAGHPMAQTVLAFTLRNDEEFTKSYTWFQKAAVNGSVIAKAMQVVIEDTEHYPPAKHPKRLKELASTGFPLINANLAAFYRQGRGVGQAPELALIHAYVASLFLNAEQSKNLSTYEQGLSERTKHEARARSKEIMFRWAKGPNTYLAKAALWCETEEYWNQSCIINALISHEYCMAPFMSYDFQTPHKFPGYSKCRYEASMSPIY